MKYVKYALWLGLVVIGCGCERDPGEPGPMRAMAPASEGRAEPEAPAEPEASAEPDPQPAPQPDAAVEPEPQPDPQPAPQPDAPDEPEPQPEPEAQPEPRPGAAPVILSIEATSHRTLHGFLFSVRPGDAPLAAFEIRWVSDRDGAWQRDAALVEPIADHPPVQPEYGLPRRHLGAPDAGVIEGFWIELFDRQAWADQVEVVLIDAAGQRSAVARASLRDPFTPRAVFEGDPCDSTLTECERGTACLGMPSVCAPL